MVMICAGVRNSAFYVLVFRSLLSPARLSSSPNPSSSPVLFSVYLSIAVTRFPCWGKCCVCLHEGLWSRAGDSLFSSCCQSVWPNFEGGFEVHHWKLCFLLRIGSGKQLDCFGTTVRVVYTDYTVLLVLATSNFR